MRLCKTVTAWQIAATQFPTRGHRDHLCRVITARQHHTGNQLADRQFITGLLLALSLIPGQTHLKVTGRIESKPYIEMTNKAYGLDQITEVQFSGDGVLTASDLKDEMDTINNIRLIDYRPTITVFNQLQSMRLYYKFVDVDIDRYNIDGAQQQVYLSARELDQNSLDVSAENLTEALSRIEDTDMAGEMATYTQYQVLTQAATSMLAQANERPQNILNLLQG